MSEDGKGLDEGMIKRGKMSVPKLDLKKLQNDLETVTLDIEVVKKIIKSRKDVLKALAENLFATKL